MRENSLIGFSLFSTSKIKFPLYTRNMEGKILDQEKVEKYFSLLLTEGLDLDLKDPNLVDTPRRVARMYCQELLRGCSKSEEPPDVKSFPNEKGYDQIIAFDRIHFTSVCPHHFLPFSGLAWILYIPGEILLGASKPARILEYYSVRPQLQENICHEVMDCIVKEAQPKGVMVILRGEHGCMRCRGIKQQESGMMSSAVYGAFKDNISTREEGFSLIRLSLLVKL